MLVRAKGHIRNIISQIQNITSDFERDIGLGIFDNEEDITSQFAAQLKNTLNYSAPDFSIKCRAIVTNRINEEPTLGADILVLISFDSDELFISKGLLAQAKRIDLDKSIGGTRPMKKLQDQCNDMLNHTLESYVWIYSKEKFRVQRACTVKELNSNIPDMAFSQPFAQFFGEFLSSMRGDPWINLQEFTRLQNIIEDLDIPIVLLISATSTDERPRGSDAPKPGGGPPDLDDIARNLGGIPLDQWSSRLNQPGSEQNPVEAEEQTEEQTEFEQRVQLREN